MLPFAIGWLGYFASFLSLYCCVRFALGNYGAQTVVSIILAN